MRAVNRLLLVLGSLSGMIACRLESDRGREPFGEVGAHSADTLLTLSDDVAPLTGMALADGRIIVSNSRTGKLFTIRTGLPPSNLSKTPWRPNAPSLLLALNDSTLLVGGMLARLAQLDLNTASERVMRTPPSSWGKELLGRWSHGCDGSIVIAPGSIRLLWQSFVPDTPTATSLLILPLPQRSDSVLTAVRYVRPGPVGLEPRIAQRQWQLQPLGCVSDTLWAVNLYDAQLFTVDPGSDSLRAAGDLGQLFKAAATETVGTPPIAVTQDQLVAATLVKGRYVAAVRATGYRWQSRFKHVDRADWEADSYVLDVSTLTGKLQRRALLPRGMVPTFIAAMSKSSSPGFDLIIGGPSDGTIANPPTVLHYAFP